MTGTRSPINLLGFEASDRLLGDLIKLLIVLSLIYIKCDHLAYLFVCYCTKFISRSFKMNSSILLMVILGTGAIVAAVIALKSKPVKKDSNH
jgi:hypothetical protein